jgi:hypothetical protein
LPVLLAGGKGLNWFQYACKKGQKEDIIKNHTVQIVEGGYYQESVLDIDFFPEYRIESTELTKELDWDPVTFQKLRSDCGVRKKLMYSDGETPHVDDDLHSSAQRGERRNLEKATHESARPENRNEWRLQWLACLVDVVEMIGPPVLPSCPVSVPSSSCHPHGHPESKSATL